MKEECEGYPFIFQMIDRDNSDKYLVETLQYRFKSSKSNRTYIVRVEKYIEHSYCLKFFDKANMNSNRKFSLRTNTFEPRRIFYTLFHIMLDVLKQDDKASFFFVGAEDERDILGYSTRRFRVYYKFVSSVVSDRQFGHYPIREESLYILVNKKNIENRKEYASKITKAVKAMYSHH